MEYFLPTSQWTKLTIGERGIRLDAYQPNLVASQFCLSQFLPNSLIPSKDCMFISMDDAFEETLAKCLRNFRNKMFYMHSFRFSLSFYYTKEFEE